MNKNIHPISPIPSSAPSYNFARVCLASCRRVLAQIKSIKAGIVSEFGRNLEQHEHLLQLAVNEAEALAWQTGFPQLLFPVLAEENARAVAAWHSRQEQLLRHDSSLNAAA